MLGFLFGTVCLIALVKVVRGGGGWGWRADGRRRWALRYLFQRLSTTPGQERVISDVADDLERKARAVREELSRLRVDLAQAMRGEAFGTAHAREAMDRQQAQIDELRAAVIAGLQKIHEALDPEQRRLAGDLLEFGPGRFGCGGFARGLGDRERSCRSGHHRHCAPSQPGAVSL